MIYHYVAHAVVMDNFEKLPIEEISSSSSSSNNDMITAMGAHLQYQQ